MKVVVLANSFHPAIGGYETVALLVSRELQALGHHVTVITFTPGPGDPMPFDVVRRPSMMAFMHIVRRGEVFVQNNVSLPWFWGAAIRPAVVIHHGWYSQHSSGWLNWKGRTKMFAARLADLNIAVSRKVAANLSAPSIVIENPYDDRIFVTPAEPVRRNGVLFVGRLVRDKGCDLLLNALARLAISFGEVTATIVGGGPEREALRGLACELGIASRVHFVGSQPAGQVAALMQRHLAVVIPSRWEEPFGVVALEALACGCEVIAARVGGLPEAVGPCGRLFEPEDTATLAELLAKALAGRVRNDAEVCRNHLESHSPRNVGLLYERALKGCICSDRFC